MRARKHIRERALRRSIPIAIQALSRRHGHMAVERTRCLYRFLVFGARSRAEFWLYGRLADQLDAAPEVKLSECAQSVP